MRTPRGAPVEAALTKGRLEALADGVFAIVMTLLVLDLRVPELAGSPAGAELARRLLELWPQFLAYVVSFLVLGIFWINHHFMLEQIKRSNSRLAWLNILFLMFVALVPFSTSMLGRYRLEQATAIAYGLNLLLILLSCLALWSYATRNRRLVDSEIDPRLVRVRKVTPLVGICIVVLAMGLSFVNPAASYIVYSIMVVALIVFTGLGLHERRSSGTSGGDTG
jgi:uncharacterized membrane protein